MLDVDVKRQRVSLTMRLDDAPVGTSISDPVPVGVSSVGAVREPRTRRPPVPKSIPEREPQPVGTMAMAMALARAKQKK